MIKDILLMIRVKQWYKNLLIFTALFFSMNLFEINLILGSILGFVALCLISSAGYIINDVIDVNRDKLHPEKKKRPIASGRINMNFAVILALLFYVNGFWIAFALNIYFLFVTFALAILTLIYSVYLKHIVFADILAISVNFILRALGGAFIIGVEPSEWFMLGVLFLAFFLVSGKRYGDILLMGKDAAKYKPVFKEYSKELLEDILRVNLTVLILIYGLYISSINKFELFYLYPIYIYILLRYYYLIHQGHDFIRDPEKFVFEHRDYPILISSFLFGSLFFAVLYLMS